MDRVIRLVLGVETAEAGFKRKRRQPTGPILHWRAMPASVTTVAHIKIVPFASEVAAVHGHEGLGAAGARPAGTESTWSAVYARDTKSSAFVHEAALAWRNSSVAVDLNRRVLLPAGDEIYPFAGK